MNKQIKMMLYVFFSTLCLTNIFALNFPTGTFTVQGNARNYNYELLDENSGITLQLVATNGAIVAECQIFKPEEENFNFRLVVPLSTGASSKAVKYGDKLNLVAKLDGTVVQASMSSIDVGEANSAKIIDLAFASYSTPGQMVPDEYIEEYLPWIIENEERTHGEYDPYDDWDDDGFKNYDEYVAGTSPTDPSDLLKVTAINLDTENNKEYIALSFEYVGGRIYGIREATELGGKSNLKNFGSNKGAEENKTWVSPSGDYGEKTVFMLPVAESPDKAFYYVVINPEEASNE